MLKKLFCRHIYKAEYLRLISAGTNKLYKFTCKKCGKVSYGDMDSRKWRKTQKE